MPHIKLICSYDGTHYLGWQETKMGPSIEGTLKTTLTKILNETPALQAASRTDAGVHAAGQVVSFTTSKQVEIEKLKHSLNCLLPKDISVKSLEITSDTFHPTLDNVAKEYHYDICLGSVQVPFFRNYSWHFVYPLDIEKMREASKSLIGKHDFTAFCNQRLFLQEDKVREIFKIDILMLDDNRLRIAILGNRFLYKMVRNIVGTLVYIGCGKLDANCIPTLLANKDRTQVGMTAPAHGLSLKKVFYNLP